jgi:hypothetical protein
VALPKPAPPELPRIALLAPPWYDCAMVSDARHAANRSITRAAVTGSVMLLSILASATCSLERNTAPAATATSDGMPTTIAPPTSDPASGSELVAPIGFGTVTVTVTAADGRKIELCLWLAETSEQHQRGLMFVVDPALGGKEGMLFRFPMDTGIGFWMKNTLLPLSIAYVDSEGSVVSIADMDPCPIEAARCPSYPPAGPYRYAIEVPRGRLSETGLGADARVEVGPEGCHTS